MDFFGIGAPELVLILLIFFIFLGPSKLPEIAGMMGKAMRKIKQASAEMNKNLQEMSDEIKETSKETQTTVSGEKGLLKELKDVSKELGDAAQDIKDSASVSPGIKKDLGGILKENTSAAVEPTVSDTKKAKPANSPGEEKPA